MAGYTFLSVGPKLIKIETYLSFDDEQNEEMESVMINVREIKCNVRETCSRTWGVTNVREEAQN